MTITKNLTDSEHSEWDALARKHNAGIALTPAESKRRYELAMQHVMSPAGRLQEQRFVDSIDR